MRRFFESANFQAALNPMIFARRTAQLICLSKTVLIPGRTLKAGQPLARLWGQKSEVEQTQTEVAMSHKFKVGDHVSWNSEAGRVRGRITRVHTADTEFMGRTRRASPDAPQYEIKSDKTDHVAMHKESALTKLDRLHD
jgi:hypothetical protein